MHSFSQFPLRIHSVFMYSDILLCRIEQYCVYSVQTEKELSKLMRRAMNEGLEGLVLKDVNVM